MTAIRLSGGTGNADGNLSLGGSMSTHDLASIICGFANAGIPGVVVSGGFNNVIDSGSNTLSAKLSYQLGSGGVPEVVFTPYGIEAGTVAEDFKNKLSLGQDGTFVVSYMERQCAVVLNVTTAELDAGYGSFGLSFSRLMRNLFGNVSREAQESELSSHRCVYVMNDGAVSLAYSVGLFKQASGVTVELGFGSVGIAADLLSIETDAPAGVAFATYTETVRYSFVLSPGQWMPVWIRRSSRPSPPSSVDSFSISVNAAPL